MLPKVIDSDTDDSCDRRTHKWTNWLSRKPYNVVEEKRAIKRTVRYTVFKSGYDTCSTLLSNSRN